MTTGRDRLAAAATELGWERTDTWGGPAARYLRGNDRVYAQFNVRGAISYLRLGSEVYRGPNRVEAATAYMGDIT